MTERGLLSFPVGRFAAADLADRRRRTGTTVSVCLPARNEEQTVGAIVRTLRTSLIEQAPLIDEVLVVDDHSDDATAAVAADAGATVVDARTLLADHGSGHGKGEALWKSLYASSGDVVVWIDADITDFDAGFVVGLLGPLLTRPDIDFVKGHYHRPESDGVGGGRVTELAARPLLAQFFPGLAQVVQPLSGEYAGRRALLETLPFVVGYGVDVALLIDAARQVGIDRLAQVDLGVRHHRNRSLSELGPQAVAVTQAILERAGVRPRTPVLWPSEDGTEQVITPQERMPVAELRGLVARS